MNYSSSSPWTKGFSISSLPSTGEMRTSRVPRATSRPSERVDVFPSSSGGILVVVLELRMQWI
jgi:hypothetical protein